MSLHNECAEVLRLIRSRTPFFDWDARSRALLARGLVPDQALVYCDNSRLHQKYRASLDLFRHLLGARGYYAAPSWLKEAALDSNVSIADAEEVVSTLYAEAPLPKLIWSR